KGLYGVGQPDRRSGGCPRRGDRGTGACQIRAEGGGVAARVGRPEEREDSGERRPADQSGPADPGGPDTGPAPTDVQVHDGIAQGILNILEESYGRGAGSARAFISDEWVVVVLDDLELLPNEQFLVDQGEHDAV